MFAMSSAVLLKIIKSLKGGLVLLPDHSTAGSLDSFQLAFSVSRSPCAGCVCDAPLAAGVLGDISGGVALLPALSITVAGGGCQVLSTAAEEALHQVAEQVTSKEHVDPRVATAAETGQQHGNDEGHVCRKRHR